MVYAGMKVGCARRSTKPRLAVRAGATLATCLLFTIHPLLGVTPTDGLVDMPEDHPFSGKVQIPARESDRHSCLSAVGPSGGCVVCEQVCPTGQGPCVRVDEIVESLLSQAAKPTQVFVVDECVDDCEAPALPQREGRLPRRPRNTAPG